MSITVTATQLQRKSPRIIALNREVEAMLHRINKEILLSSRSQLCSIEYSPLLHFNIPDMDNKDSQSIIFGKIIEILEEKEYTVEIVGTGENFKFIIIWDLKYNKKEIEKYQKLLIKHHKNVKNAQLDKINKKQQYITQLTELIKLTEQSIL